MESSNWKYRGEGNASLVITNSKEVYKLRKRKCISKDEKTSSAPKATEDNLKMCQRTLCYSEQILRPLLGEQFVPIAEIVPISKDFITSISDKVKNSRPVKRLNTEIDQLNTYAICLPDLCFIQSSLTNTNPVFCIEIKPKMGFLPKSMFISAERSIKKSACRFCMYQKLKVEYGTWESASLYCPLDLFSGDEDRMMYALNCLVKTPQNNLKIFMNGQLLYANNGHHVPTSHDHKHLISHLQSLFEPQETKENNDNILNHSCLQDFIHLIQQMLMFSDEDSHGEPKTKEQCIASHFKPKPLTEPRNCSLHNGCILDRILKIQQLDHLDIEGVDPLYHRLQEHLIQHPEDREKYSLEGPFCPGFVEQLPMLSKFIGADTGLPTIIPLEGAVQKIREFLMAATAKDCSIMLTMRQTNDAKERKDSLQRIVSRSGKTFEFRSSIVDLDPKPSIRIPMYNTLDKDINQFYMKYNQEEGRDCH